MQNKSGLFDRFLKVETLRNLTILLVGIIVIFSLFHYYGLFRVHDIGLALIIAALFFSMLSIRALSLNIEIRRGLFALSISVFWAVVCAFVLPFDYPVLAITTGLILTFSLMLNQWIAYICSAILILGLEGKYLYNNEKSDWLLFSLFVQVVTLSLISVVAVMVQKRTVLQSRALMEDTNRKSVEGERLKSLINSMTDGVVATDSTGKVAIYNGAALDIINLNATLDGKSLGSVLKVSDKKNNPVDVMQKAEANGGYLMSRDYLLDIGEDERINLYVSISPVRLGYGKSGSTGHIVLLRDITREKSLEEERDEFISVVSHELRTPVTITEGNISNAKLIANNEGVSEKVKTTLNEAHKQVVFLADMINDLATLSRAERGKLQDKPEEIDIHDLIKGLQRDYRTSSQQKGLIFNTYVDRKAATIFSSRLYLREILQNFITNAIKYTQKGEVRLSVEVIDEKTVAFSVKDSGIGISVSDQKMLFNKFFRSEDYRTRENNGTGLGLYVTKKLAKLIKGEISVESKLNEGSKFTLTVHSMEPKK